MSNQITNNELTKYNSVRAKNAIGKLCHAPFSGLNIEQNGNVTACCYNRTYVLGKYPDQSLEEIWFGRKLNVLRKRILENDLSMGCANCAQLIKSGNYSGTKAIQYDKYAMPGKQSIFNVLSRLYESKKPYPHLLELELSNTCNLECVMCNGYFSSSIRKNRECLPALKNPFDTSFVKQVSGFIPHLSDIKLLGGEPFLIDVYYEILEQVITLKPSIRVHITTNGTVMNNRVRTILQKLEHPGIVVSIDSLDKETYESTRVGANLENVLSNLDELRGIIKQKQSYLTIAVCPMVNNWQELPTLTNYANKRNMGIHFNTVWTPNDLSLRSLDHGRLENVVGFLEKSKNGITNLGHQSNINLTRYTGVVDGLKGWMLEKEVQKTSNQTKPIVGISYGGIENELTKCILMVLNRNWGELPTKYVGLEFENGGNQSIKWTYLKILEIEGAANFLKAYFQALIFQVKSNRKGEKTGDFQTKAKEILSFVSALDVRAQGAVANDIIEQGAEDEWQFYYFVTDNDLQAITQILKSRYSLS